MTLVKTLSNKYQRNECKSCLILHWKKVKEPLAVFLLESVLLNAMVEAMHTSTIV